MPNHFKEFSTFKDTWLINRYIGGGIKTFRFNCHKAYWIKRDSWLKNLTGAPPPFICNTHPHNYYLEILTELGLIGFFILSAIWGSAFIAIKISLEYFAPLSEAPADKPV